MYEEFVGKIIEIINLEDELETFLSSYRGRKGEVKAVGRDAWGDYYLSGTWGGINIYPGKDNIRIVQ